MKTRIIRAWQRLRAVFGDPLAIIPTLLALYTILVSLILIPYLGLIAHYLILAPLDYLVYDFLKHPADGGNTSLTIALTIFPLISLAVSILLYLLRKLLKYDLQTVKTALILSLLAVAPVAILSLIQWLNHFKS